MIHTDLETHSPDTKLPTIVYFSYDHSNLTECTDRISSTATCAFKFPSSWSELATHLESGEHIVAIHISMIKRSDSSILDFLDAIKGLYKCMPISDSLKIAVIIDQDTTQHEIFELRKHKVFGLLLDIKCYPIDDVCAAISSLIAGIPYWAKHITGQLPNPLATLVTVYFRKDWATHITPLMAETLNGQITLNVRYCASWEDLDTALLENPHQLVIHADTIRELNITIPEIISMIETRLRLYGPRIPVAIEIEPTTALHTIKELKKCGVFGIVPSTATWGINETITAIHALAKRVPYWPKHIIDQLPGNKLIIKNKKSGISVTPRQSQVLDLICNRGLSNKQIAKSLSISESTVKIHIGCILKEYGVRNRTQLVLAASCLLKA